MEQEKEKVKVKKTRGRPSESDKKELKEMIPNMTNAEAKDLVEYYKKKYIESQISN